MGIGDHEIPDIPKNPEFLDPEIPKIFESNFFSILLNPNKKDMKPFHIDRELEHPILFKNVLSCLRTGY